MLICDNLVIVLIFYFQSNEFQSTSDRKTQVTFVKFMLEPESYGRCSDLFVISTSPTAIGDMEDAGPTV